MKDSRLDPCPNSPKCVCSQGDSESHAIAPYHHYEVTSRLVRFVDDVEILFDDASKTIHFRSAARVGFYDFGVNRRRMEEVRRLRWGDSNHRDPSVMQCRHNT